MTNEFKFTPESKVTTDAEITGTSTTAEYLARHKEKGSENGAVSESALRTETAEIQKLKERISDDEKRFEADKNAIHQEIGIIKEYIKKAEDSGDMSAANNWGIRLSRAEDVLNIIEKGKPLMEPLLDQEIHKKMEEYRRTKHLQSIAELRINTQNSDKEALGEYLRQQATAAQIAGDIDTLIRKRGEANDLATDTPTEVGSIHLTNEENDKEKAYLKSRAEVNKNLSPDESGNSKNEETDSTPNKTEPVAEESVVDKWQEEAIKTWENMPKKEGEPKNKVPDLELLLDPEKDDGLLPLLIAENPEKNIDLIKRIESSIAKLEADVDKRAENLGAPISSYIRKVGETWSKFPLRYKLLLSAGMIASGVGAAAFGATATAGVITGIGAGMRAAGGASMFVIFEKMIKKHASVGKSRIRIPFVKRSFGIKSEGAEIMDTVNAAMLAIIVAGILPGVIAEKVSSSGLLDGLLDKVHNYFTSTVTVSPPVHPLAYMEVAEKGDTVWGLIDKQLGNHYAAEMKGLSPEQRTYIIDAIKDKIEKAPETYGVSSSNIDALTVGDRLNFGEILQEKDFMGNAIQGAKSLSEEQIANIQGATNEVASEAISESPEFRTEFIPKEPQNIETLVNEGLTSQSVSPTPEPTPSPASTMPQEIIPGDTATAAQIEAHAYSTFSRDIDKLFGRPSFLWFGHTSGLDSMNWNDAKVGFKNFSVGEIMDAHPDAEVITPGPLETVSPQRTIGIENSDAVKKMQEYIMNVGKVSGMDISGSKKVEDLVHDAVVSKLSK